MTALKKCHTHTHNNRMKNVVLAFRYIYFESEIKNHNEMLTLPFPSLFFFPCLRSMRILSVALLRTHWTHEKWRAQTNITQSLMRMRTNKLVAYVLTLNLLPLKKHAADWCENECFILHCTAVWLLLWGTALHFNVINSF